MPKRIQRKRTKGWKMPEGAVYVGRPTIWGNPYRCPPLGRQASVDLFRKWIIARDGDFARTKRAFPDGPYSHDIREKLRGKDLVCWCPLTHRCHADVLLEIANL